MGTHRHIDRKKHEVDVAERVLTGGVRTEPRQSARSNGVTFDLSVRGWALGLVASAVQVQVIVEDVEVSQSSDRPRRANGRTRPPPPDRGPLRWP
jgi:hypothetical protein